MATVIQMIDDWWLYTDCCTAPLTVYYLWLLSVVWRDEPMKIIIHAEPKIYQLNGQARMVKKEVRTQTYLYREVHVYV